MLDRSSRTTRKPSSRAIGERLAIPLAPIFKLPAELWFEILDYLPVCSIAALSYTSKQARCIVGTTAAHICQDNAEEKYNFLKLLEREMPPMAVLCFDCNTYHCKDPNVLHRLFRKQCEMLKRRQAIAVLPKLTAAKIYRVMKQQRLGPSFGLPLDTLSMNGSHRSRCRNEELIADKSDDLWWEWSAWSKAKVVDGQLILKVLFHLKIYFWKYEDFLQEKRYPRLVIESVMCGHGQCDRTALVSALRAFVASRNGEVSAHENHVLQKGAHCRWCNSEYFYMLSNNDQNQPNGLSSSMKDPGPIFTITRYVNLGTGLPEEQKEWKALNTIGTHDCRLVTNSRRPSKLFDAADLHLSS